MKSSIAGAVLLIALSTAAFPQTYSKDNLPCIQEFCLGDGLSALAKVPWDRAKRDAPFGTPEYAGTAPIPPRDRKRLDSAFRGAADAAMPYLYIEAFDAKALPVLAKVRSACQRAELLGTFKSQSGNPTRVKIALLPDKFEPRVQRWAVISITRTFPEAKSAAQKQEVRQQLDARYERFSVKRGNQQGIAAAYTINESTLSPGNYGFSLFLYPDTKDNERYEHHPACGGAAHVPVD